MLFKREIKRNYKAFLVTTLLSSFMAAYIVSMSNSFSADIQQIIDMKLPKQLQIAFGMNMLNFNEPISFFAMAFSYIYLFLGIYMSSVFAVIVSKEFSEKTAEYLFSLPEKRIYFIHTKLSVALLYSFLCVLVIFIASLLSFSFNIKQAYSLTPILLMTLAWLLGGLCFGSLGFLISSFTGNTRTATSIAVGLVLVMYLLQVVISLNKSLSFLKYISPFDWFKGDEIAQKGSISLVYCVIALAIILLSLYVGIKRYSKKDVLI